MVVAGPVDVDSLPPTQYLILEVLAARHQLGEQWWTFPAQGYRRSMGLLADAGLIGWKSGVEPRTILAWLTDTGKAAVLLDGYEPSKHRPAAAIMSWDWRGQPDLDHLARLIRDLTGGALHLRPADTGCDEHGIVLSTAPLDEAAATAVYRRQWNAGAEGVCLLDRTEDKA